MLASACETNGQRRQWRNGVIMGRNMWPMKWPAKPAEESALALEKISGWQYLLAIIEMASKAKAAIEMAKIMAASKAAKKRNGESWQWQCRVAGVMLMA
jgi:hypothetical protein